MHSEIYYFSATGNSLIVARKLAEKIGARLHSMSAFEGQPELKANADMIGLVFPVYHVADLSVPLIVKRFISRLSGLQSKYIFAVYTCGGGSVNTAKILRKMIQIQGGKLDAGFQVHMPQNAFKKPWENKEKVFKKADKKIEYIADYLSRAKAGKYESSGFFINLIFKPLIPYLRKANARVFKKLAGVSEELPIEKMILLSDNSFYTDENCNGCGICAKVCPVENIEITDGKPEWQNRCEDCLACYNWCPNKAIHGSITSEEKPYYYRHPDIRVTDISKKG